MAAIAGPEDGGEVSDRIGTDPALSLFIRIHLRHPSGVSGGLPGLWPRDVGAKGRHRPAVSGGDSATGEHAATDRSPALVRTTRGRLRPRSAADIHPAITNVLSSGAAADNRAGTPAVVDLGKESALAAGAAAAGIGVTVGNLGDARPGDLFPDDAPDRPERICLPVFTVHFTRGGALRRLDHFRIRKTRVVLPDPSGDIRGDGAPPRQPAAG